MPELARRFGTPTYVYSHAALTEQMAAFDAAFAKLDHLICYAVKANASMALLSLVAKAGWGFDAVSVGELAKVAKAGGPLNKTILSGVGKRDDEIAAGLAAGVLYLTVESADELEAISRLAKARHTVAAVSLRINPDVDAGTHPHITTGRAYNKFGMTFEHAAALLPAILADGYLRLVGLSCHIGSQILETTPFARMAKSMSEAARALLRRGAPLQYLSIGGGLGVRYVAERAPSPTDLARAVAGIVRQTGLTLVLEPGRAVVANAGMLLTRVVRRKSVAGREIVIVDAGMNDFVRPALYGAKHRIESVTSRPLRRRPVDYVGPVCESADTFLRTTSGPLLREGDLVAICGTGAYGTSMASNYNGRLRAAEVLCDGSKMTLVRTRESLADLWQGEHSTQGVAFDTAVPAQLGEIG